MNSRINVNSAFCLGGFYRECYFTNGWFFYVYYKFINDIVKDNGQREKISPATTNTT